MKCPQCQTDCEVKTNKRGGRYAVCASCKTSMLLGRKKNVVPISDGKPERQPAASAAPERSSDFFDNW